MPESPSQIPEVEIKAELIDLRAEMAAARRAITEAAVRFVELEPRSFGVEQRRSAET